MNDRVERLIGASADALITVLGFVCCIIALAMLAGLVAVVPYLVLEEIRYGVCYAIVAAVFAIAVVAKIVHNYWRGG